MSHGQPARCTQIIARVRGVKHSLDGLGSQVAAVVVHVGEDRNATRIDDAGNAGHEGSRRDDDFIAVADPERLQGDVERQCAVRKCNRVTGTAPCRELALELATLIAGPVVHPVGDDDAADGIRFLVGETGPRSKRSIQHAYIAPRNEVTASTAQFIWVDHMGKEVGNTAHGCRR